MVASALGQHRVGGDDGERRRHAGLLPLQRARPVAAPQRRHLVEQAAVVAARAGDEPAAGGIDDVAERIDGDERGHRDAADAERSGAEAAAHRPADAEQLADAGAGAGADVALGRRRARRGLAGGVAGGGVGADRGIADPEIEQDRRRHDRHRHRAAVRLLRPDGDADAALVEPAHHAAGGVEAEGAAAGEQDGVHLLDRVERRQQLGLARAGRGAADVDAADRAALGEDDGAAGRPARIGEVADREAGDGGQSEGSSRSARRRDAHPQANTPAVSCIRAETSPRW